MIGQSKLKRVLRWILWILPVLAVYAVKQSAWGPILDTPQARQTGDPKARLVIVEYSDFQCPSCAAIRPTVHQLMDYYKGKVRLVFKYFPLKMHQNAMPAAHAAECAAEQEKFWPYEDKLFTTQAAWGTLTDPTTSFMAMAAEVGLDQQRFTRCWQDPSRRNVILNDIEDAKRLEVHATPTFFVGTERLVGNVLASDGARAIERELKK